MRLRDTLLLSDDDSIVIPSKFCITTYNPSQSLVSYYTKARLYYKKYTKKDIDRQIEEAAADMEQSIHERETSTKTIAEILSKLSIPKGKLH
jgi:predicted transcriptional regulator